ncbi:hypothetical protein BJP40_09950 [Streptomyces sp. CC53]|uniref:hypothetical protein n=1 Tax=unclassified Streptomyces TaxID=2593676 RepID=UPI0008DE5493|nr:hypothetical protein BJP40_09950 [Streptomyces sp. CC53]
MKFTDGSWRLRDGVRASYATEVRDVHVGDDHSTAYAAVGRAEHHGHTVDPPLLTVECFSPAEGVIGVRTTQYAGRAPGAGSRRRSSTWPGTRTAACGSPRPPRRGRSGCGCPGWVARGARARWW